MIGYELLTVREKWWRLSFVRWLGKDAARMGPGSTRDTQGLVFGVHWALTKKCDGQYIMCTISDGRGQDARKYQSIMNNR